MNKIISGILAVTFCFISSAPVFAESGELPANPSGPANVVITELQANGEGTGTTTQEFIEFYNPLDVSVDLTGWTVVYVNSSGKETLLYSFTDAYQLPAYGFLIGKNSATATSYLPELLADFTYSYGSSGLAASAGGVVLKDDLQQTIDELYWVGTADYINDKTITRLQNGMSAQRKCDDTKTLAQTGIVPNDFEVTTITPAAIVCPEPPINTPPVSEEPVGEPPVEETPPEAETPSSNDQNQEQEEVVNNEQPRLRLPIYINELFIDPTTPLTDSQDEFTELYNPNTSVIDLSGYSIVAGSTTKYSYTFPDGSELQPFQYVSVTSAESTLALANSGGEVVLKDDQSNVVDTVTYGEATAGSAWARNNTAAWEWTTTVTKNAVNSFTAPKILATAKSVTTSAKKTTTSSPKVQKSTTKNKTNFTLALPIVINELYPDPKSPETDSKDEFIELYNPHDYDIYIADYTIIAGTTKQYKYTIPEGVYISAGGYYTVTSADSPLSMTNSGGEVRLLNNFDTEIDKVSYDAAQSGQAYARNDANTWQWTSTITKNARNEFTASAPVAVKNKITKVSSAAASDDVATIAPAPQPIPGWVLAVLGVSAVCYAAYEYRFEVRNSFYKFRANRRAG